MIILPSDSEIFNTPIDASNLGSEAPDVKLLTWETASLTQEVGGVIPLIYGRHVTSGNLINAYIEEGENETLNMLIALCEGGIESVTNVKVNGTPIEKLYGNNPNDQYNRSATVTTRLGTVDQEPISEFGDLHNNFALTQELEKNVDFVYEGVLSNAECFRLEFWIDQLYQQDENKEVSAWHVSFQIEYKRHADVDWKFLGIYNIDKEAKTGFKRYAKSEYLPPDRYDIRVRKVSDNDDSVHGTFGKLYFMSVDEIVTETLIYPRTALLGLRLIATDNLQTTLPNVTAVVTGMKVRVPKVTYTDGGNDLVDWDAYYWDGAAQRFRTSWNNAVVHWDGVSYVQAWSGNPVWCLRDLLLSKRYGLGDLVSEYHLNDDSFLAAALYCDEMILNNYNKNEKRFMFDCVFNQGTRASEAVQIILSSFRGMMDTSAGKIRITVEKETAPVFMFNVSNILRDSFTIQYTTSKVPNVLSCTFANKDKYWLTDTIEIGDEEAIKRGENFRQSILTVFGCTRLTQIIREAKIQLAKYLLNRVVINFEAYLDAVLLQPNDVFSIQHELPAWGEGGRVAEGSTRMVIRLGQKVTLERNKTYEIMLKNQDNDAIEVRRITNVDGIYDAVIVDVDFSFTPKAFDLWSVGIVEESIQTYRALTVGKATDGKVMINAMKYTAGIYDPSYVNIPQDNYSHISLSVPDVSSLTLTEKSTRQSNGTIISQIEVSFLKPTVAAKWIKKAVKFEVYLSTNDGRSWSYQGVTDREYFLIPNALAINVNYRVAVVSVAEDGTKNLPTNSPIKNIGLVGWQEAPAQVDGFIFDWPNEIVFSWEKNQEPDIAGYEMRYNDINWGVVDLNQIFRGLATTYTLIRPLARSGVPYFLRAYNSAGIYSKTSAILTPQNEAPASTTLSITTLFQKAFLSWLEIYNQDMKHYEVWSNDSPNFTGIAQLNEKLIGKFTGISAVVEVPWSPTYYRVRGVDSVGVGAWSNTVDAVRMFIDSSNLGDNVVKAAHIQAGSITADHIATNAVTADKIAANSIVAEHLAVDSLSALSADIGYVIAGTIVGTVIKTSEDAHRTELNQLGLFSYDENGNMVVKMSQGQLCMIDATDSRYYSRFDAGQLKFITPYETVPYLKRVQNGVVASGSTVTLCRWYESPNVMLGLKKLKSYDQTHAESTQDWCVYADNMRPFCNGAGDFGWKFDVHAKLTVTGGTRPERVFQIPYGITCTTCASTCQIQVKQKFQIWCNDVVPADYQYGIACFEVKYRVLGCGVWCSAPFCYAQPHSTVAEIQNDFLSCQTVQFPCNAQWEVQMNMLCVTYSPSTVAAGNYETRCCCYQFSVDNSRWETCMLYAACTFRHTLGVSAGANGYGHPVSATASRSDTDQITFHAGWGCVCKSVLTYSLYGNGGVYGQYGGGNNSTTVYCSNGFIPSVAFTSSQSVSATGQFWCCTCYWPGLRITWWGTTTVSNSTSVNFAVSACQEICIKNCIMCWYWCKYEYKVWCGVALACCYNRWYSMTEVSGAECILDSTGEVSYLAVAYS